MKSQTVAGRRLVAAGLLTILACGMASARPAPAPLPNPILYLIGTEAYTVGGQPYLRYNYQVFNFMVYPDTMFAAGPGLPPCGANTKSARSWVDLYDQAGKRLYGFCDLGKSSDLNTIWFGLPIDQIPPSYIYIEINDRQTNTKYKSNLADTTL